jgi:SNF2 family DNA or RNA helicase
MRLVTRNTVEENIWKLAQEKTLLAEALRGPSSAAEEGGGGPDGVSFQRLLAQALAVSG